ncbi:MAG: PDZ domain-containing protein [Planctomycetes bacterium]|nr:PDZ domain-containing protein [Planctomycetota bacterium]MCW8136517.1 PDZ domain-containing protein [Planctomycetota bacterium]
MAEPDDPAGWLDSYLHDADARDDLRPKLLALGADKLTELIRAYPRPKPPAAGEHKFETRCPDGFTRPYWLWLPDSYDGETPAALIVCLHGGVMAAPVDSSVAIMRWYAKYLRGRETPRPVVVLAASADCYNTWMNAAWWRDAGRANIHHFIREAKLRLNIDADRVFVSGFSDGGSGSFAMAFNSPDMFAGYFPMCGDPLIPITDGQTHCYSNLKGAKIFAINGVVDPIYPGKEIEKLYKEANKDGANIQYQLYPDAGHDWGDPDVTFPRFLDLVDQWKREQPADIDWCADRPSRRNWLSIDETGALDKKHNKAKKPVPRGGGSYRIDLGIKVPGDFDERGAPRVGKVDKDSVAELMGVRAGDLIRQVDDTDVANFPEIRMLLGRKRAGDNVKLSVDRDGERHTFTATIPRPQKRHAGRVQAKGGSAPSIEVHDVTKLSVWVSSEMLNDRKELTVRVNREKAFSGKVAADAAVLLDEFARSGERTPRFIARLELDVRAVLK